MSFEVKFGWYPDNQLVFAAFQPDGTGRGIQRQPLPEVRNVGYYRSTPATDLVISDVVLVYLEQEMTHEDSAMYYLYYADLVFEGVRMHHDGDLMTDFDTAEDQNMTWVDKPCGVGEFQDVLSTAADIDVLSAEGSQVLNIYGDGE